MSFTTRNLASTAMIAALYTALCTAFAPLSFGVIQVRIAEALAILPVFSPIGVWGVTLGCALSNVVGFFMGANPLGALDILFGTTATLVAALLTRGLRHWRLFGLPVAAALPPVLINAVVVGAELAVLSAPGEAFLPAFAASALYVGAGQLIACFALGLPLAALLERTGTAQRCFGLPATTTKFDPRS